jgi:uncharacterized protein (TIGR03437 family)
LLLALSTNALGAANSGITVQVSSETAPPGGFAQFKVSLTAPALVSQASISMSFDPTIFGPIASVAAFSATGDQTGQSSIYSGGQKVQAALTSQSSSLGQMPGLPVLVVTVPVLATAKIGATSSITFDPSPVDFQRINSWGDPHGNPYALTIDPGTFTVGGSLSTQSVTPSGGLLPSGTIVQIDGTGFDATTTVAIDGVSVASTQLVSSQQINVALGGSTEMNGKHVHVSNAAGESRDYFAALSFAVTINSSSFGIILPSLPSPASTVVEWPVSSGDLEFFTCLQNPSAAPVTVTYYTPPFGVGQATSQSVVVPPYGTYAADTNVLALANQAAPQIYMTASAPLRMASVTIQPENFLPLVGVPAQLTSLPPLTTVAPNGKDLQVRARAVSAAQGTVVSPASLVFSLAPGQAAPAQPQTVSVQLAQSFTAIAATESGANWLTITYNGSFIYVNASAANLSAGTYLGAVTITSENPTVTIPVTLIVAPPGQMSVTPSSLTLTAPAGTSASGVISVGVVSGTPYFTVQAASLDPNQFESATLIQYSVSPGTSTNEFTAPATIQVTGTGSGLPSIHYSSLTVSWDGGSATIPVTIYATAAPATPPVMSAIVSSGSSTPGAIAPGELISIFGMGFSGPPLGPEVDSNGNVAANLGGTQILINDLAAPLVYVSPGQVNAVVPFNAGSGAASIQVIAAGLQSGAWAVPLAPSAPSIFTANASGVGQAAIVNQDGSINSASNPALRGTAIQIYATGGGQISPPASTGIVAAGQANLALPVSVTVGGVNAQVLYAGAAPGEIEGVVQVNVMVPQSVTPGVALPVLVTIGSVTSQTGVTVAIQ